MRENAPPNPNTPTPPRTPSRTSGTPPPPYIRCYYLRTNKSTSDSRWIDRNQVIFNIFRWVGTKWKSVWFQINQFRFNMQINQFRNVFSNPNFPPPFWFIFDMKFFEKKLPKIAPTYSSWSPPNPSPVFISFMPPELTPHEGDTGTTTPEHGGPCHPNAAIRTLPRGHWVHALRFT